MVQYCQLLQPGCEVGLQGEFYLRTVSAKQFPEKAFHKNKLDVCGPYFLARTNCSQSWVCLKPFMLPWVTVLVVIICLQICSCFCQDRNIQGKTRRRILVNAYFKSNHDPTMNVLNSGTSAKMEHFFVKPQ